MFLPIVILLASYNSVKIICDRTSSVSQHLGSYMANIGTSSVPIDFTAKLMILLHTDAALDMFHAPACQ